MQWRICEPIRRADHRRQLGGRPIERILDHIGEPTQPRKVLPARSPPQPALGFDQTVAGDDWPDMDQAAGTDDGWQ